MSPVYDTYGYDEDGYDNNGYDRLGYDRQGYNCEGHDRQGYNQKGYDLMGYDRMGNSRPIQHARINTTMKIIDITEELLNTRLEDLTENEFFGLVDYIHQILGVSVNDADYLLFDLATWAGNDTVLGAFAIIHQYIEEFKQQQR